MGDAVADRVDFVYDDDTAEHDNEDYGDSERQIKCEIARGVEEVAIATLHFDLKPRSPGTRVVWPWTDVSKRVRWKRSECTHAV